MNFSKYSSTRKLYVKASNRYASRYRKLAKEINTLINCFCLKTKQLLNNIKTIMMWKNSVSKFVSDAKDKVVELNLDTKQVKYSDKVRKHREINKISGDEELVRAFLLSRLVNELGYTADRIELEKEYPAGRKPVMTPRIDVILRDAKGQAFLFIECKAPDKFESDKQYIRGQLFELAKLESSVKYLVYYTIEETAQGLRDKLIIIDREKYPEYEGLA